MTTEKKAARYALVIRVRDEAVDIARLADRIIPELPSYVEILFACDFDDQRRAGSLSSDRASNTIGALSVGPAEDFHSAIEAGMRATEAPVVVIMTADASFDISKVEPMVRLVEEGAAVVCAGGDTAPRHPGRPFTGTIARRLTLLTLHWLGVLPVHDPTTSFRAYDRAFLEATPIESEEDFAIGVEVTAKAWAAGERIEEVLLAPRGAASADRDSLTNGLAVSLRWYGWALWKRVVSARAAAVLLLVLAAIGVFVPVQTSPEVGIEYWAPVALSEAFLSKRAFGTAIVDTHGPWGFVVGGYYPETLGLSTLLRIAIVATMILAVWEIGRRRAGHWIQAALLVILLLITGSICWPEFVMMFWSFAYLIRAFELPERRTSPLGVALLATGGLLALVKFSAFVSIGVVVALVTVDDLIRRLRPVSLIVWCASIALFWLGAGQKAADFHDFIRWSVHVTRTYTEGIAFDAELYQPWTFGPFLISTVIFAIALALVRPRGPFHTAALRTLALWASLFFLFKWGFVRADHFHVAPAVGTLLVVESLFAYAWWSGHARRRWLVILFALAISISASLAHGFVRHDLPSECWSMVTQAATGIRRLALWCDYEQGLLANHHKAMAMLPPAEETGTTEGTVDAYPSVNGIVLRDGVEFRPRPVFRSYNTFSEDLTRLNAAHLRDSPPDAIVFSIDPVDRRYPSLEDGASWPFLLENYVVEKRFAKALVLRRRHGESTNPALSILTSLDCRLGEPVDLPDRGPTPLYARIEIELTTAGRILNILYKPPDLEIGARLADGTTRTRRFLRNTARTEFLLTPYVDTVDRFAALYPEGDEKSLAANAVRQITISAKGNAAAYGSRYTLTLLSPVRR